MTSEPGVLRLRYVERPVMPGTRLTIWQPAGCDVLGAEPFASGDGFTVDVTGDEGAGRWRTVLRSWETRPDGTLLELEVEGRYPETGRELAPHCQDPPGASEFSARYP